MTRKCRLPPDDFVSRVLDVVAAIPPGHVMAYGEVAAAIGSRAARAVGSAPPPLLRTALPRRSTTPALRRQAPAVAIAPHPGAPPARPECRPRGVILRPRCASHRSPGRSASADGTASPRPACPARRSTTWRATSRLPRSRGRRQCAASRRALGSAPCGPEYSTRRPAVRASARPAATKQRKRRWFRVRHVPTWRGRPGRPGSGRRAA